MNCLHSFARENNCESHKKVFEENKCFCNLIIPSEDTKILEFNQYWKSDKAPFIIYSALECLSTISSFKNIENKHDMYRGKDCMKKFCESLRDHAIKIINIKKKKNDVITKIAGGIIWKCKKLL